MRDLSVRIMSKATKNFRQYLRHTVGVECSNATAIR